MNTRNSSGFSARELTEAMVDSKGRHVPIALVKPIDLAREDVVRDLIARAKYQSTELVRFKRRVMDDIYAFVQLSAERFEVHLGGQKGNISLVSYDGTLKVQLQVAERLVFDERLQAAKALIDECIRDWSATSGPEVRVLIEHAFQVDQEGKVNTARVLGLRRLAIDEPRWLRAMTAISESVTVADSKSYVRFYERDDAGKWHPIVLDIAAAEKEYSDV